MLACVAFVGLSLAMLWLSFGPAATGPDDGWRRTADGWQRLPVPATAASTLRLDVHPAALTLLQLAAALVAMSAFPRPGVTRLSWLDEDWRAFFWRSFRASAFGS